MDTFAEGRSSYVPLSGYHSEDEEPAGHGTYYDPRRDRWLFSSGPQRQPSNQREEDVTGVRSEPPRFQYTRLLPGPLTPAEPVNSPYAERSPAAYCPTRDIWGRQPRSPGAASYNSGAECWTPRAEDVQVRSPQIYSLLALVGIGASSLSFAVDTAATMIGDQQGLLTIRVNSAYGGVAAAGVWVLCGMLATAVAFCITWQTPAAQGSGIPEIKCEIRGLHLKRFLTSRVVWTKAVGLALCRGAGLPIGKEGPFVHFAASISDGLIKRVFRRTDAQKVRRTMLTASVAVGVGATFSVPISGVLFALEAMPDTAWHNTTYWSCLVAAIAGSATLRSLRDIERSGFFTLTGALLPPVVATDLKVTRLDSAADPASSHWFLITATLFGAFCGVCGALFTMSQQRVHRCLTSWRVGDTGAFHWIWKASAVEDFEIGKRSDPLSAAEDFEGEEEVCITKHAKEIPNGAHDSSKKVWARGLILCMLVAVINSSLTYLVPPLRCCSQARLLGKLFSEQPIVFTKPLLANTPEIEFWADVPKLLCILAAIAVKLFTTLLALGLPVPCGCISPVYVLGALLGRFIGKAIEVSISALSTSHDVGSMSTEKIEYLPARFALVGAASFGAGVCRSFSMAVAIFELMPVEALLLPMASATILSMLVANHYCPSIFDAILKSKKLPATLQFRSLGTSLRPVASVMDPNFPRLPRMSNLSAAKEALDSYPDAEFFALLGKRGTIVGTVSPQQVARVRAFLLDREGQRKRSGADSNTAEDVFDVSEQVPGQAPPRVTSPLKVPPSMPLQDVAVLFVMHRCQTAYVVDKNGKPRGIIRVEDIHALQS